MWRMPDAAATSLGIHSPAGFVDPQGDTGTVEAPSLRTCCSGSMAPWTAADDDSTTDSTPSALAASRSRRNPSTSCCQGTEYVGTDVARPW